MSLAFTFPGQGSQAVGMGADLAEAFPVAAQLFEEVDEALGQKLFALMKEGPETELTLTENAQPALMAVSMAVMRVLEHEGGFKLEEHIKFVAGHSLGEYSALTAAGALSVADCARALKIRGQAMQAAVPVGEGAMAAILGLDIETATEVANEAAQGDVCAPANDNAVGQLVLSGSVAAIERAVEIAKEKGAKKAMMLQVSAPFHCPLMQPAADRMAEALGEITITAPIVPLIANVTADLVEEPEEIRELLVKQVTGMVRWRESVLALRDKGAKRLVEVGSGKVLTTMLKRIDKELQGEALGTPEQIDTFLKSL